MLSGDGGALHWRERARYHQGSTHGATLSAVTSTEALWRVAHAPPAALALVPRPEEVSEATCAIPVVSAGIWTREIVL